MIKRILIGLYNKLKTPSVSRLKFFFDNGNLTIGSNCRIDELIVEIYDIERGANNILIGNDCHLMGKIVLYSKRGKVKIGDRVFIGPDTTLFCYDDISIESDVLISWGCTLITTNAHSLKSRERADDVVNWKKGSQFKDWSVVESKSITVKTKSWIGFNSIITKGVTIEEGTVVASGSVVTKSTEKYTIVGGNPATFIKDTE